ncbi:hypothetical protein [Arthrobacter sp. 18067]|uniref:hypothetical protein n=1 Tax=Arthrobacter sp. 18067 TaxID=2681413 RepID=UPI002E19A8CA
MRASDQAYMTPREDIIGWRLRLSIALAEKQSDRAWASETPVREALNRLTTEVPERSKPKQPSLLQTGERSLFAELHARLLGSPELLSDNDPARHDYYGLVSHLDEAIESAISNSCMAQAIPSRRVQLVRVRRPAVEALCPQSPLGRSRHHTSSEPQSFPHQGS